MVVAVVVTWHHHHHHFSGMGGATGAVMPLLLWGHSDGGMMALHQCWCRHVEEDT